MNVCCLVEGEAAARSDQFETNVKKVRKAVRKDNKKLYGSF